MLLISERIRKNVYDKMENLNKKHESKIANLKETNTKTVEMMRDVQQRWI